MYHNEDALSFHVCTRIHDFLEMLSDVDISGVCTHWPFGDWTVVWLLTVYGSGDNPVLSMGRHLLRAWAAIEYVVYLLLVRLGDTATIA